MTHGLEEINNYIGLSMNPTLKAGDGLIVEPYKDKKIACGDVITFRPREKGCDIVHRVIRVDRHGVRTRGDNSCDFDPWVLAPDDVIGRVISVKRGARAVSVAGGLRGRIYGLFIRRYNMLIKKALVILYPIYRFLSHAGIFRSILPLSDARIFAFLRSEGVEHQYVMGNRILARRLPGAEQWQIRRPYRLLIDEEDLNRRIYADNRGKQAIGQSDDSIQRGV
jgi:signal peptidase I